MSFGYSIGDFIAGANLSYRLIQALSGTQCASNEYREAILELGCMQQTFLQVGRMTSNPHLSPATINAASHIVLSSVTLIGDFLTKTKKYRDRLSGTGSGNAMSDSWQKMGWVLFKKDELKALKDALHVKLASVSLLLDTAQFYERMPSRVARYEVTSLPNSSPSSSYTHLAGDHSNSSDSYVSGTSNITTISPKSEVDLQAEKISDIEVRFAQLEELVNQQRKKVLALREGKKREGEKTEGLATSSESGSYSKSDLSSAIEEIFNEPEDLEVRREPEPQVDLFSRFEKFLKVQRQKEVHDTNLISELEKILAEKPLNNVKLKPIKFKDAVGRKFSFPFEMVRTWAGMESVIRQAFEHVEVIGPLVEKGHYDLVGPNGEIILPQFWEMAIEPDWAITMQMWPIPEPRPKLPDKPKV